MFTLACLSYKDKESIPAKYTHHSIKGQNISPGFRWNDPPLNAKSFAFTVLDPHPVAKNWVHWMVINIPLRIREIPEGSSDGGRMPPGSREIRTPMERAVTVVRRRPEAAERIRTLPRSTLST